MVHVVVKTFVNPDDGTPLPGAGLPPYPVGEAADFIQLLGEIGEDGLAGTGASPVTVMSGTPTSAAGDPAPAGATAGTLVVNPDTGVIYQVGTPVGGGPLQLLQHPNDVLPVVSDGLRGTPGHKGPDGEVGDHTEPDIALQYLPTTYDEMWKESYYPVLPGAPEVAPGFILTSGVGNTIQVKLPDNAGNIDHPYWQAERPDGIPDMDLSKLRIVVTRGQPTPLSPWLALTRIDYTEVMNPGASQTISVSLPAAWPVSATDADLWVTAYLWDVAGNGPVASQSVKANSIVYTPPPVPDRTPPGAPTVAVVWDPNTLTYTVTVTAPTDPDLKEVRVWQRPDSTTPTVEGLTPIILPSTPGQVRTFTFQPTTNPLNPPFGYTLAPLPPGEQPHGVVMAAWYAQAYDTNLNAGSPGLAFDYQPASPIEVIPPTYPPLPPLPQPYVGAGGGGGGGGILQPGIPDIPEGAALPPRAPGAPPQSHTIQIGPVRAKSRAYDKSGSRADSQWGQGVMHTGYYGSVHDVQWGAAWIDLRPYAGARAISAKLTWTSSHTYYNSGADFWVGYHTLRGGLPSTLRSGANGTYFNALGKIHVPKNGPASIVVPANIAQRMIDGQVFGFIFGSSRDATRRGYSAININSVKIVVRVES